MLFDSLHNKLLPLPDAASSIPRTAPVRSAAKPQQGNGIHARRAAPLNYALQPMTKEAFIQVVTADQPEAPAYFTYDAVLNSEERPTLDQALHKA